MTKNEIIVKIDELETQCFYEEMADFIDWPWYNKTKAEIRMLKLKLAEMGE